MARVHTIRLQNVKIIKVLTKDLIITMWGTSKQCLGFGSVGSARFWFPGSGSVKIRGSEDLDQRGKISTKNCIKNFFTPKTQL